MTHVCYEIAMLFFFSWNIIISLAAGQFWVIKKQKKSLHLEQDVVAEWVK